MRRFAGLEICRFLCAVSVILWHYQHFFLVGVWNKNFTASDRVGYPFYGLLQLFYNHGDKSVGVFWVISGFIFFWKYAEQVHDGRCQAGRFAIWRLSRLYPLHFFMLIIVAILQIQYTQSHAVSFIYSHNDVRHFILQLVFASNWTGSQAVTFDGPVWSVSTEIVAYACFFVWARMVRLGVGSCLAVVAVVSLALAFRTAQPVLSCIQYFFVGGLVQLALSRLPSRHTRRALLLSSALAIAAMFAVHWIPLVSGLGLLVFSAALVGVFSLVEPPVGSRWDGIVRMGDLTYSSYLIHFPLQLAVVLIGDSLSIGRGVFRSPIALLTFLIATFILARVAREYIEKPSQDFIRAAWSGRRRLPLAS